jgi:signal transduction histidine kinase
MFVFFRRWLAKLPEPMKRRSFGCMFVRNIRRCGTTRFAEFGLFLLASCLLFQAQTVPELKQVRRVVVFYELGLSSPAIMLLDREMRGTLETSQYQIELYREYLETTLFDDPADQEQFRESYIRKYQKRRPDLIIAIGPSPLRFMVDVHKKFFAGIPVVFGGTSEQHAGNPILDADFTGCWEMFDPTKTLDAALNLQPGTRHVVVVGGNSSFDKHLEAIFRESLQKYEAPLDYTYLTDLDMPTLLQRLKHLPEHTIVLYTHIGMDAKANRYIGASQAAPMIANAANAPVFSPSDVDLGHGEVGGYVHSFAREGRIVGGVAVRILGGARPQDIPIARGANVYMFDWRALNRWGFSAGALPSGSEMLYRPPTVWQRYKWAWVESVVLMLFLSAIALNVRLKWAKDRQFALSGMLINAQEKERSRIASEIHDDFSQRLALMALDLENAEETISTSPDEAARQVHNVLNSASEIGADLHTLSHRLHSSTLERLGLVPGVTALCKEFEVKHGIEVDFISRDVPNVVRPDVALCLFRIAQEGLRNMKKHSGVAKAQIRLGRAGDKLFLSVSDDGIGFDARDLGKKEGLGIRSMEERAYLLGGKLEIHSKPGKGTRIETFIPFQPKPELPTERSRKEIDTGLVSELRDLET